MVGCGIVDGLRMGQGGLRWSFEGTILVFIKSWKGAILVCIGSCEGEWHVTVDGMYVLSYLAVCFALYFCEVALLGCCRGCYGAL